MKKWIVLACVLGLFVGMVLADSESYRSIPTAPAVYRTAALDGNDSNDWTSPLNPKIAASNPTGAVKTQFTGEAATTVIKVGLYHQTGATYTFMGIAATSTRTASSVERADGTEYTDLGGLLLFDTSGASAYDVRITDPSSGQVTLRTWAFGDDTQ